MPTPDKHELPVLGEYLKAQRKALGLSQRAAAVATGWSSAHISQLETGVITNPSIETFLTIAKTYGISLELLAQDIDLSESQATTLLDARALQLGRAILALPEARQAEIQVILYPTE